MNRVRLGHIKYINTYPIFYTILKERGRLPFDLGAVHALRWHVDQDVALRELKGSLDYHRARHVPTRESVSEEHTFLRALQLAYLLYVENYTRMAGVVHRGFREAPVQPRAVVMRSSFSITFWKKTSEASFCP